MPDRGRAGLAPLRLRLPAPGIAAADPGRGRGLLIYQLQEGRGIGILNKLKAYELQDQGLDTVEANTELGFEADLRHYGACAGILRCLGVGRVRLLSNNPGKVEWLRADGIQVEARLPLEMPPDGRSRKYLQTKRDKLGHLLDI